MDALEKLFTRFALQKNARWWVGKRPKGRDGHMAWIIAKYVDYPTSAIDPFEDGRLVGLDRDQAAHVLAAAGMANLASGSQIPSKGIVKEAREALKQLNHDAIFLSNGRWDLGSPTIWTSLTAATFDCGLIGYDKVSAFIFWIEEED